MNEENKDIQGSSEKKETESKVVDKGMPIQVNSQSQGTGNVQIPFTSSKNIPNLLQNSNSLTNNQNQGTESEMNIEYKSLVVIEATGGGIYQGGVTSLYGEQIKEKDITLKIALLLENYLRNHYIIEKEMELINLRTTDTSINDQKRIKKVNDALPQFVVLLQTSIAVDKKQRGYATCSYKRSNRQSYPLQEKLHVALTTTWGAFDQSCNLNMKASEEWYFKEYKVPTVAVRVGHLTNQTEASYIQSELFQHILAAQLALAIANHLELQPLEGMPALQPHGKYEGRVAEELVNLKASLQERKIAFELKKAAESVVNVAPSTEEVKEKQDENTANVNGTSEPRIVVQQETESIVVENVKEEKIEEVEEQPKKKEGFFSRLFKRNK